LRFFRASLTFIGRRFQVLRLPREKERTGGEPDVFVHDKKTGEYIFFDCSAESPKGRTSLCYDREALDSRKERLTRLEAQRPAATDDEFLLFFSWSL
jgi:hypothetical protein